MDVREKLVELVGQVQDCGCDVTDVVKMNYVENNTLVDHLIANGVTVQSDKDNSVPSKWISVKDRLPESGVHILASVKMDGLYCSGHYVCDAFYAAKYTQSIRGYSDECACVYCEEDDEYYLEEGWHEVIKNRDDYNSIVISDTVTHWMPLPIPPKGE